MGESSPSPQPRIPTSAFSGFWGGVVGVVTALIEAGIIPVPAGPSAAAGATLGPAILLLLMLTVGACILFAIIGTNIRSFRLASLVASLPAFLGAAAMWSGEPLFRVMLPYAGFGVASATLVGRIIRSRIEQKQAS